VNGGREARVLQHGIVISRRLGSATIMGNSLRCCLACVLPCGALDLVRIVHLSGRVDEYGRAVSAGEVLAAHPNHVLSRPCTSSSSSSGHQQHLQPGLVQRRILVVAPDAELQRGEIYFLIPAASVPDHAKKQQSAGGGGSGAVRRHVRSKSEGSVVLTVSDQQLGGFGTTALTTKKKWKPLQQHRRRMSTGSHASPWQPHLACIAEDI
jgi:hypothetical protein